MIECGTCGEDFDPADLAQVCAHEHVGLTEDAEIVEGLEEAEPGTPIVPRGYWGNHSTERSLRDLRRFHVRFPRDGKVFYPPKEGFEAMAREYWRSTGVCPSCHARAITVGRCIQCGETP